MLRILVAAEVQGISGTNCKQKLGIVTSAPKYYSIDSKLFTLSNDDEDDMILTMMMMI